MATTIKLKSLRVLNFKKLKGLTVHFKDNVTSITADNGLGKSTIKEAYSWCWTGKSSLDKEMEIKTWDSQNIIIDKLEHEVELVLEVSTDNNVVGREIILKRGMRDNWIKPKGNEQEVLKGNNLFYAFNRADFKAGEFAARIDSIINPEIFKLLSFPQYFNSLHWERRREILMVLAKEINPSDIIGDDIDMLSLFASVSESQLSMEKYKESIVSRKNKAKIELGEQKPRIEEVKRANPEEPDYDMVNSRISVIQSEIESLDKSLTDASTITESALKIKQEKQEIIYGLKSKLQIIENTLKSELQASNFTKQSALKEIANNISQSEKDLLAAENRIKTNNLKIPELDKKIDAKRKDYEAENNSTLIFKDNEFICSSCGTDLSAIKPSEVADKKEVMLKNFNLAKSQNIQSITLDGKALNQLKSDLEKEIAMDKIKADNLRKKIEELKLKLPKADDTVKPVTLDDLILANKEYQELKVQIAQKQEDLNKEIPPPDVSEFKTKKDDLQKLLDAEKKKLTLKEIIEKNNLRIKEIQEKEQLLSRQITAFERDEFALALYAKRKSEIISERVNKLFSNGVRFKLFNTCINGSEEPTCETLVDGVPYGKGLNLGGEINAGLEIIKVLSEHYEIYCPVWLDNSESISEPLMLQSQMILLNKVKGVNELLIK